MHTHINLINIKQKQATSHQPDNVLDNLSLSDNIYHTKYISTFENRNLQCSPAVLPVAANIATLPTANFGANEGDVICETDSVLIEGLLVATAVVASSIVSTPSTPRKIVRGTPTRETTAERMDKRLSRFVSDEKGPSYKILVCDP